MVLYILAQPFCCCFLTDVLSCHRKKSTNGLDIINNGIFKGALPIRNPGNGALKCCYAIIKDSTPVKYQNVCREKGQNVEYYSAKPDPKCSKFLYVSHNQTTLMIIREFHLIIEEVKAAPSQETTTGNGVLF